MLVRTCYTKAENLSPQFDEIMNRTTRNLQFPDWAEYMVAWRKDRLEIYKDHVWPSSIITLTINTDKSRIEYARQGVDLRS
jgi:hypothetical protein